MLTISRFWSESPSLLKDVGKAKNIFLSGLTLTLLCCNIHRADIYECPLNMSISFAGAHFDRLCSLDQVMMTQMQKLT